MSHPVHRPAALLAGMLAALAFAAPASAHQTVSDHGATVTVHVAPDDAPVAGQAATINVVSIKVPKRATFRYARARVKVTDASGAVLLDRVAAKRIAFTFPKPAAYQIVVSGSYERAGKTRRFSTTFAIRADAA
ncbi:MAG: hypothetical protein QOG35_1008 [Solirubrobacteraceae bacterium]|jgi:hypothetical protein|nr:hypothetical protein [Solirubrobacteraceae bacterium]